MLVFPIILSLMILTDSWFSATLGYTSAGERIAARAAGEASEIKVSSAQDYEGPAGTRSHAVRDTDGWLCPVDVSGDSEANAGRKRDRRASNKHRSRNR